jgi:aminoglycoside phosphotransferase (APT) family kinase protein
LPLPDQPATAIVWQQALPADLTASLEREAPHPPAVIHLDYHPFNCMERDDEIVAVLDWANACIADPRYDVARTLAILTHAPVLDPSMHEAVAGFTRQYLAAYGGDPLPPVFRWWAGVTMLADLLPKRDHPALGWITDTWVAGVEAWTAQAREETLRND